MGGDLRRKFGMEIWNGGIEREVEKEQRRFGEPEPSTYF
jgi:hypothetical protein